MWRKLSLGLWTLERKNITGDGNIKINNVEDLYQNIILFE